MAESSNIARHLYHVAVHLQCSLKTMDVFKELADGTFVLPQDCSMDVREAYEKYCKLKHRYEQLAARKVRRDVDASTARNGVGLMLSNWSAGELHWAINIWRRGYGWALYKRYPDGRTYQWLPNSRTGKFRWLRCKENKVYDHSTRVAP